MTNPVNGIITNAVATGTINDNDTPPQLTIDDVSINEGDGGVSLATFTVNLSEAISNPIAVDYNTVDGTAISGEDYQADSGTLTFNPGETSKTIDVAIIGDTVDEVDGTFIVVNLSSGDNILIDDGEGIGTIIDDDQIVDPSQSIFLAEGNNFKVEHLQAITIPTSTSVLNITYSNLNFDTSDANAINDAFEIALVDNQGNSLVHTIGEQQDAFFNYTEGESPNLAAGVTASGQTITVNLTDVPANTNANLILRLVNNDGDINTSVSIEQIQIDSGDGTDPIFVNNNNVTVDDRSGEINFASLVDVSASITPQDQQTSFNEESNILSAELALLDDGTYYVDNPLIVAVKNISDPNIRVVNADGITPDGLPYYDFSNLINSEELAPGAISQSQEISFSNPEQIQFSYELVVFSTLNNAPEIVTQANTEVIANQPYRYDVDATDLDDNVLSYSLLSAPTGMNIDSSTGEITWNPTINDLGNHSVTVLVEDGKGGSDRGII